jgi:predicted AAA+ superfamily ATPase
LIRLSTGFGGGKTHTLMALWHLANNIEKLALGTDLLPAAGRPKSVNVVAVDAAKAGIPVFGTHGATKTHSLQGEVFSQLGGTAALKALGAADHHEASPDDAAITKVLPDEPLLILLDELVVYMAGLSAAGQGNFMSFLGKLISAISKRKQAVLVITDPGQQTAYAGVSHQLASAIGAA